MDEGLRRYFGRRVLVPLPDGSSRHHMLSQLLCVCVCVYVRACVCVTVSTAHGNCSAVCQLTTTRSIP
ncbi:unnamed protein product [Oncorhynchus mykiss]|uniref:Uncharacterized protein n=1 Tax=Oncorhynchus mykiss TaxID=8022 RepID=A0A060WWG7_ONCMY|nr:unnamed protein product [Oncorhynchus mykiss]